MNRNNILILAAAFAMLSPGYAAGESPVEPHNCVIGPHTVLDVSSAVPGLLEVVMAERSDSVRAGQVLARLESGTERASLELARAWSSIESEVQIERTAGVLEKRREQRISQLFASQAIALDDKEQAETQARLARLRLQQAKEKRWIRELDARKAEAALDRRTVRSPIDGVVVERYRGAGEYVENQPILRIARLDPLEIETILPMAVFGQVAPGMVAEVRTENQPDTAHRAVVSLVDRMGDVASGTFGVRLTLANPGNRIPAGLKCTLSFVDGETAPVPFREMPNLAVAKESQVPVQDQPASTETNEAGSTGESADVEAEPTKAINATTAATLALRPAGRQCLRVGPMSSAQAARTLADGAVRRGLAAKAHQATLETGVGYIVLTSRQRDLAAAAALVSALKEAGAGDAATMYRGDYAQRVSLGVYAGQKMAEQRRDSVRALGFDVDVVERTRARDGWWVNIFAEKDAADVGWLKSAAPGLTFDSVACRGETHSAQAGVSPGDMT